FIGQEKLKDNLRIFIEAALARQEPIDHVLLYGPPGLGKTTLAHIIGSEMGVNVRTTSGPAIEHPGELAAVLTRLARGDIVFIDDRSALEIARRSRGTPRVANRLLKRVRDFAQIRAQGSITGPVAEEALDRLEVDPLGLDEVDRKLLLTLIDKFGGGPVGIETLAAATSE